MSKGRIAATLAVSIGAIAVAAGALAAPGVKSVKTYNVGSGPSDVAVGDFNRDGRRDLAVTNFDGDKNPAITTSVTILRGRKGGRFKPVRTILLPEQPDGLTAARVNKGKQLDLLVGSLASTNGVLLLKGKAGFKFAAPAAIPVGNWPRHVATGDFNRDGYTDFAASRQDTNDIAVVLGAGGGGFEPLVSYPGADGSKIVATRLDGDRRLDLVTSAFSTESVVVYRGLAAGNFAPAQSYAVGSDPRAIAVADLNRDGRRDVIVGRGVPGKPKLTVLRGTNGGFKAPVNVTIGKAAMSVESIAVAKLNGDRDPDLIVSGQAALNATRAGATRRGGIGSSYAGRVVLLRGRAGIKLKRISTRRLSGFARSVAAGRFDRGRSSDAAVTLDRQGSNNDKVGVILTR